MGRGQKDKALVTGLKSKKKYEFKVMAANAILISQANKGESEIESSKAFCAALGFTTGVVCAPFATVGMLTCGAAQGIKYRRAATYTFVEEVEAEQDFTLSTTTILGITAATLPLSLLLSPITVPLMAIGNPIAAVIDSSEGDVTPVSEDED